MQRYKPIKSFNFQQFNINLVFLCHTLKLGFICPRLMSPNEMKDDILFDLPSQALNLFSSKFTTLIKPCKTTIQESGIKLIP